MGPQKKKKKRIKTLLLKEKVLSKTKSIIFIRVHKKAHLQLVTNIKLQKSTNIKLQNKSRRKKCGWKESFKCQVDWTANGQVFGWSA